jgi:serine/threonine-protein kinase
VRGDLDAIIARALDRDPQRRYATAAEFAADIRAFLGNFPVQARPATRAYIAHKFAQRHWGGILSALLVLLVLIGATLVTMLQLFEARHQRDFARTQLARAEALNELNYYVLTDAAPAGKPFTVTDLLGRAAHLLERQHGDSATRVALLASLGQQFDFQDENQRALEVSERAYRLSQSISDPSARSRAACELSYLLAQRGSSPHIEALLAEGLQQLPDDADFALDRYFCLERGAQIAKNAGDAELAIRGRPLRCSSACGRDSWRRGATTRSPRSRGSITGGWHWVSSADHWKGSNCCDARSSCIAPVPPIPPCRRW